MSSIAWRPCNERCSRWAIAALHEACRRAYVLVRERQVSHADAAAVLQVTPSAVSVGVVRAQRALRKELERNGIQAPIGTRRRKNRKR